MSNWCHPTAHPTYSPQRSAWCPVLQSHQQWGNKTKSQQWENSLLDNSTLLHQHNAVWSTGLPDRARSCTVTDQNKQLTVNSRLHSFLPERFMLVFLKSDFCLLLCQTSKLYSFVGAGTTGDVSLIFCYFNILHINKTSQFTLPSSQAQTQRTYPADWTERIPAPSWPSPGCSWSGPIQTPGKVTQQEMVI